MLDIRTKFKAYLTLWVDVWFQAWTSIHIQISLRIRLQIRDTVRILVSVRVELTGVWVRSWAWRKAGKPKWYPCRFDRKLRESSISFSGFFFSPWALAPGLFWWEPGLHWRVLGHTKWPRQSVWSWIEPTSPAQEKKHEKATSIHESFRTTESMQQWTSSPFIPTNTSTTKRLTTLVPSLWKKWKTQSLLEHKEMWG